jgi:gamma-glutamyl hydrolase
VATAVDQKGKEYIAIVEGFKYPLYAVQFHPEMVTTNRSKKLKVPTNGMSVRMSANFAQFFVEEARKNNNDFGEEAKRKYKFIDSFVDNAESDNAGFYLYKYKNNK